MMAADQASRLRRLMQRRTRTIALASGKGGVGKSCLALNLAILMSAAGRRVALVDADLALANLDIMLDVDVSVDLSRVIEGSAPIAEVVVDLPCGVQFVPGASGLAGLADLTALERARLQDELSGLEADNDIIVIDCGAGIGPAVLSLAGAADVAVVVTTPEPTAMTDAYALIKVLARTGLPGRVVVVANMVSGRAEGRETTRRIAKVAGEFLGVVVAEGGSVPSDVRMAEAVRQRQPLVLLRPHSAAVRHLASIASMLCEDPAQAERGEGFFRRVMDRFA